MVAHLCRLTKRHIILVPSYGWKFHQNSGRWVGSGFLGPSLDLQTLKEIE
jgi:hypothetical protein